MRPRRILGRAFFGEEVPSFSMCMIAAGLSLAISASAGGASPGPTLTACFGCHGPNGQSQTAEIPSLGGQPAFFGLTQLFLFREGRRNSAPMIQAAKGLSDDDMRAYADLIAKLPPPAPPAQPPDAKRFGHGEAVVRAQRCGACHGAVFAGGEQVPRLANQREDYLVKALREFKSGARLGYVGAMAEVLAVVAMDDLPDVAHYFAYFPPSAGSASKQRR